MLINHLFLQSQNKYKGRNKKMFKKSKKIEQIKCEVKPVEQIKCEVKPVERIKCEVKPVEQIK